MLPADPLARGVGTHCVCQPALPGVFVSIAVSPGPLSSLQCLRQEAPRRVQAINAARHAGVSCAPGIGPAAAGPGRAGSCPWGGPGPTPAAGAEAADLRRAAAASPAHAHAKDDV